MRLQKRVLNIALGVLVVALLYSCGEAEQTEIIKNQTVADYQGYGGAEEEQYFVLAGSSYIRYYNYGSLWHFWRRGKSKLYFFSHRLTKVEPPSDALSDYRGINRACFRTKLYAHISYLRIKTGNRITANDLGNIRFVPQTIKDGFKIKIPERISEKKAFWFAPCKLKTVLIADLVVPEGARLEPIPGGWKTNLKLTNIRINDSLGSEILAALSQEGAEADVEIMFTKSYVYDRWRYLFMAWFRESIKIIPRIPQTKPQIEITEPQQNLVRIDTDTSCLKYRMHIAGTLSHPISPSAFVVEIKNSALPEFSTTVVPSPDGSFEADVDLADGVQTISASVQNHPEVVDQVVVVVGNQSPPQGKPLNGTKRDKSVADFGLITPTGGRLGDNDLWDVLVGRYNQFPDAVEWVGTQAFVVGGYPGTKTKITIQWVSEQAAYRSDVGFFIVDPKHPPRNIREVIEGMDDSNLFILFNSGNYGECCPNNVFEPIDGTTRFEIELPAGTVIAFILFPNHTLAQAKQNPNLKQHTTIPWLNPEGNVHTLVFESPNGRNLNGQQTGKREFIVAFEDISITRHSHSDQDFSDIVISFTLDQEEPPVYSNVECTQQSDENVAAIPEGEVWIGCDEDSLDDCFDNEIPYHSVRLSPFLIDKHEVTVAEFKECVEAGACSTEHFKTFDEINTCNYNHEGFENHPMNCINWYGAEEYCEWKGGRLPTEAEWEYAARGTDGRLYPWGNEEPDCTRAVIPKPDDPFQFGCGAMSTMPVCSKPEGNSPFGLCDMVGNVNEWTLDWYDESYYQSSPTVDPKGPAQGEKRTLRGGSWMLGNARNLRASTRWWGDPVAFEDMLMTFGFRCVYERQ